MIKMDTKPLDSENALDGFVAELTSSAYGVALHHGFRGSFIDLELELWAALREAYAKHTAEWEAQADGRRSSDKRLHHEEGSGVKAQAAHRIHQRGGAR
jgi:hypothetical protein